MNQSFDPSTIILAVLAIFIVWKLRSVLGTRTGEERPPFNPFLRRTRGDVAPSNDQDNGRVIPLPGAAPARPSRSDVDPKRWTGLLAPDSQTAAAGLDAMTAADAAFSAKDFLAGARSAYELIVAAYARGDRDALKMLLAKDVFDGFSAAIAEREGRGQTIDHTFVALDRGLIEEAQLRGRSAQITVLFDSQQINAIRSRDGALVEAGSDLVGHVIDHWTFARETDARDPNWRLVATNAE